MAKARKLEKRRRAIRNIRKITRTMELVARASFSRAMNRALAAAAYTRRITALAEHLAHSAHGQGPPIFGPRRPPRRATLLMLTANRGLCGGYNAAVFRLAHGHWLAVAQEVPETRWEVSGKRGISALRFRGIQPAASFTHFRDRPRFEEVEVLADRYLEEFQSGRLDRLDIVYTRFEGLTRQRAVVETLLPFAAPEAKGEETRQPPCPEYDFFPSAASILEEVLPASFKARLFKCFLDAAASEQIARMMAMKAATENADAIIANLTMMYNRARQGQITSELLEVVGGADALMK
ncbi:MAG: ATP synthase F1 subunit gamma [Thermoguttaceae bacterium]